MQEAPEQYAEHEHDQWTTSSFAELAYIRRQVRVEPTLDDGTEHVEAQHVGHADQEHERVREVQHRLELDRAAERDEPDRPQPGPDACG